MKFENMQWPKKDKKRTKFIMRSFQLLSSLSTNVITIVSVIDILHLFFQSVLILYLSEMRKSVEHIECTYDIRQRLDSSILCQFCNSRAGKR